MFYRINKEDGYIHGVVEGVNAENENCTEVEYNHIKSIIENAPEAPDGFYYRLKENLEWELFEVEINEEENHSPDSIGLYRYSEVNQWKNAVYVAER